MSCNNVIDSCKERFDRIEAKLDADDKILTEHETDIAVLNTNVTNLIKSLGSLTKALWGVCGTVLSVLLGFFIWYVQSL